MDKYKVLSVSFLLFFSSSLKKDNVFTIWDLIIDTVMNLNRKMETSQIETFMHSVMCVYAIVCVCVGVCIYE